MRRRRVLGGRRPALVLVLCTMLGVLVTAGCSSSEGGATTPNPDTAVASARPVRQGDGYAPVDPPHSNQAVWVRYRPLVPPFDTGHGTSYVYGYACHHHVCAFTRLTRAGRGDVITIQHGARAVQYVIVRTSADFPKSGPRSLANRDTTITDRAVRHRLVLITCAYETGDLSLNDLVIVAVPRRAGR